jgi:hypothetical protein
MPPFRPIPPGLGRLYIFLARGILFIYLLCFASKHHTTIALRKLGHHNSLTPITVGPLQNININIENRNN